MHTSIGAKLFNGKLDYCLKVDDPITNVKNRGVNKPHFSVLCTSPVEQYLKNMGVMAITKQFNRQNDKINMVQIY